MNVAFSTHFLKAARVMNFTSASVETKWRRPFFEQCTSLRGSRVSLCHTVRAMSERAQFTSCSESPRAKCRAFLAKSPACLRVDLSRPHRCTGGKLGRSPRSASPMCLFLKWILPMRNIGIGCRLSSLRLKKKGSGHRSVISYSIFVELAWLSK